MRRLGALPRPFHLILGGFAPQPEEGVDPPTLWSIQWSVDPNLPTTPTPVLHTEEEGAPPRHRFGVHYAGVTEAVARFVEGFDPALPERLAVLLAGTDEKDGPPGLLEQLAQEARRTGTRAEPLSNEDARQLARRYARRVLRAGFFSRRRSRSPSTSPCRRRWTTASSSRSAPMRGRTSRPRAEALPAWAARSRWRTSSQDAPRTCWPASGSGCACKVSTEDFHECTQTPRPSRSREDPPRPRRRRLARPREEAPKARVQSSAAGGASTSSWWPRPRARRWRSATARPRCLLRLAGALGGGLGDARHGGAPGLPAVMSMEPAPPRLLRSPGRRRAMSAEPGTPADKERQRLAALRKETAKRPVATVRPDYFGTAEHRASAEQLARMLAGESVFSKAATATQTHVLLRVANPNPVPEAVLERGALSVASADPSWREPFQDRLEDLMARYRPAHGAGDPARPHPHLWRGGGARGRLLRHAGGAGRGADSRRGRGHSRRHAPGRGHLPAQHAPRLVRLRDARQREPGPLRAEVLGPLRAAPRGGAAAGARSETWTRRWCATPSPTTSSRMPSPPATCACRETGWWACPARCPRGRCMTRRTSRACGCRAPAASSGVPTGMISWAPTPCT